ncbi:S-layer homology domain-containing protein [Paenibacillus sp. HWE-109]|uniref:S-layer homology domain-containing protein n=1 Tax=Paenibacillus sp. HWE-109 TaxID=1306526 RepID=UPI001EDCEF35|nr:S-layer homology domain-containing protein [Paenibacillus sp. HWE-109]UKS28159.1 S-layer homology domain-containing protein [Paenibacillus sp. HWE-109]
MKHKFHFFFLAIMLIATVVPLSAAAQVADEFVLRSSAASVEIGDNVTITIAGEALTDLYAAQMELTYDEQLEYTGYTSSLSKLAYQDYNAYVPEPKVHANKIKLLFTLTGNMPALEGKKDIFTLSFKASKVGTPSVSLSSLITINSNRVETNGKMGKGITLSVNNSNSGTDPGTDPGSNPGSQGSGNPSTPSTSGTSILLIDAFNATNGVASIDVESKALLEAGKNSKDGSVTIKVNSGSDVKELQLNLPAMYFQQLRSESGDVKTLRVETELATVSINRAVLDTRTLSDRSNLQLSIAKADTSNLSQNIRDEIGNSVVYDFNLSLDGSKITNFIKNSVIVELPYKLGPNENPYQVVIYYITEDGKLEIVRNGKYNTDTGRVQFLPTHFSKYTANHVQVSFGDMKGYTWANEGVLGLAAREVVNGRSEGHYMPAGEVTRAEFVKMLIQLFDLADTSATAAFTDVDAGAWYYNSIASAQKIGLIQGKDDGSFGVNDQISREDMAVLIYRASKIISSTTAQASGTTSNFLDGDQISTYAKDAVWAATQAGLMDGVAEGYFDPKGKSTRAQAATVIYRLYQELI